MTCDVITCCHCNILGFKTIEQQTYQWIEPITGDQNLKTINIAPNLHIRNKCTCLYEVISSNKDAVKNNIWTETVLLFYIFAMFSCPRIITYQCFFAGREHFIRFQKVTQACTVPFVIVVFQFHISFLTSFWRALFSSFHSNLYRPKRQFFYTVKMV